MNPELPVLTPEQLLVHARWVRRLARQLVSDPNLADDAVQETWIAVMKRPPHGDASSQSVRAWLAQVLRRSLLQVFRSESRRADRENLSTRDELDTVPTEQELFDQVDGQRLLVQEVLELPEPMRSTVILRYFKDQSSAEIARHQGVPAATVRSRLSRALEELRVRMDSRYEGNRSAWCVALAGSIGESFPITTLTPTSSGPSAISGSSILKGIIAMKVGTGLAIAVGIAALTVAGIALLDLEEEAAVIASSDERASAPEVAELAEIATLDAKVEPERSVVETEPAAPDVERATKKKAPEPVAAPEVVGFAPCILIARFTDPNGNPVAGVEWSPRSGWAGIGNSSEAVRSLADGTIRLTVPMERETRTVTIVHSLEGFVSGYSRTAARAGEEVNVGTIKLPFAVRIAGRVVDDQGHPFAGADVFVMSANQGDNEWGELERIGPQGDDAKANLRRYVPNRSSADGSFELTGAVSEVVRVYAHSKGYRYSWSDELVLDTGGSVLDLLIVLTPLEKEDHIAGVVLDVDGQPAPNMSVSFTFADVNFSMTSSFRTDESGAFDLVVRRQAPHSFRVEGTEETPGTAAAPSIPPGTLDLVLQLALLGGVQLFVQDVDGNPISEFTLETETFLGNGSTSRSAAHSVADGYLSFPVPADRFGFEVKKRGYGTEVLGPFDAATYPGEIRCTLIETPGIHGVVVADGEPVEGAVVRLMSVVPPGSSYAINGFPSRFRWGQLDGVITDEDGAFRLSAPEDGDYVVCVEPPPVSGLASAESDELHIVVTELFEGVHIEPQPGGTLVVAVLVAPGQDLAGIIVGITDGGRDSRTVRTDENGVVRFEGLRPGRWLVEQSDQELSTLGGSSSSSSAGLDYEIPFNCDVRSGKVTDFELAL